MNIKLSVIIPVYNADTYLNRCLDSVINQNFNNFQVILVNDGSTDNSKEICEKYSRLDKRINLINQNNLGVSRARNVGLKHANGEYILFVDADDWLDNDMFELMVGALKNNEYDLVACNYYINNTYKPPYMTEDKFIVLSKHEAIKRSFDLNYHSFSASLWNKIFLHDLIKKHNMRFDERLTIGEDFVFLINYLVKTDNKIAFLNIPKYHYFINSSGAVNMKFNERKISAIDAHNSVKEMLSDSEQDLIQLLEERKSMTAYNLLNQATQAKYKNSSVVKKLQKESRKLLKFSYKEHLTSKKNRFKFIIISYNYTMYKIYILLMKLYHRVKKVEE